LAVLSKTPSAICLPDSLKPSASGDKAGARFFFWRNAADLARDIIFILDMHLRAVGMLVIWSASLTAMMGFYVLIKVTNAHSSVLIAMVFLLGIVSFVP
jgi:hypothetical protein